MMARYVAFSSREQCRLIAVAARYGRPASIWIVRRPQIVDAIAYRLNASPGGPVQMSCVKNRRCAVLRF
jgi:hypothetical protein